MGKNLAMLAELDSHDCKNGFDHGCAVCRDVFFSRSRAKWNRLQEKWRQVRERANSRRIDAAIVSAIMAPTEEEKQNAKY